MSRITGNKVSNEKFSARKKFKSLFGVCLIALILAITSSCGSSAPASNPVPSDNEPAAESAKEDTTKEDTAKEDTAKEDSAPKEQKEQEVEGSDDQTDEITPLEIYTVLQENEVIPYTMSSKAEKFLTEHPNLFSYSGNTDDLSEYTDFELEVKHINKNPDNHGDKLMYFGDVGVMQISETEINPSLYLTEINAIDIDANQYYILYIGSLDDVFEYDDIEVYGLPLGKSSFENTEGGQTLVIVLAGCSIEKLEF